MKTIITTLMISCALLTLGCDNKKNDALVTTATTPKTEKPEQKTSQLHENKLLPQQGNYNQLLNMNSKDCSFISSEIVANMLDMPMSRITQGDNTCTYFIDEQSEQNTRFYFKVEQWSKKMMLKEIKMAKKNAEMFGKDSTLSQYRISETGDTYLSMHQNRMVRVLNETSDVAIIILYSPKIEPDESDIDKIKRLKETAKEQAFTIANELLKKYQTK